LVVIGTPSLSWAVRQQISLSRSAAQRSIENDDPARDTPRCQQLEAFVDFLEPVSPADQAIEIETLGEVQIGQDAEIYLWTDRAVVGPGEFFLHIDHIRQADGRRCAVGRNADQHGMSRWRDGID